MTIEEKNELHRLLNGINSALCDAHIEIEDRLGECVDNELTPVYVEISALKLIIAQIGS